MTLHFVTAVSRRKAQVRSPDGKISEALLRSNAPEVVCGDLVHIDSSSETAVIESIKERKNLLSRSYRDRTKLLAANLSHLYIVSAVAPLFNTVFIDRTIAACTHEGIPFSLIVNKTDLATEETEPLISIYTQLGVPLIYTCAKKPDGLDSFMLNLSEPDNTCVALCGISGVGKSSLLKRLIPEAAARTSDVSKKTGQGRQTTTMATAYQRIRPNLTNQFIIDLPGLQHFGISHMDLTQLRDAFSEFKTRSHGCQFLDCAHISEPNCAIVAALQAGEISQSRYDSYRYMREEIQSGKSF